jgi:hypothetical protein
MRCNPNVLLRSVPRTSHLARMPGLKALPNGGKCNGFDEDPITLGGVKEGSIVGTVVQQPFECGYQGMKLMAKVLEGISLEVRRMASRSCPAKALTDRRWFHWRYEKDDGQIVPN